MATAEFDFAYNCPLHEFLHLLDKHQLKPKSWVTNGPGGGNPAVILEGSAQELEKLLIYFHGADDPSWIWEQISQ